MATPTDLWGAIDPKELIQRTPLTILREQARLLGDKTGNLVEAQVETSTFGDGEFMLILNLVVPALGDYTYELFKIRYPVALYPVSVLYNDVKLKNEEAFVSWLHAKLSSPDTHRIVGNLLSQASS